MADFIDDLKYFVANSLFLWQYVKYIMPYMYTLLLISISLYISICMYVYVYIYMYIYQNYYVAQHNPWIPIIWSSQDAIKADFLGPISKDLVGWI